MILLLYIAVMVFLDFNFFYNYALGTLLVRYLVTLCIVILIIYYTHVFSEENMLSEEPGLVVWWLCCLRVG